MTHSSREQTQREVPPAESLVSRSSALPVFCFLVSGPGLSFPSYHTPGTVPIRTPTTSGDLDLPFLPSPYLRPRRFIPFRIPHQACLTRRPATRLIPRSPTAHPFHQELLRKGLFPPATDQCHLRSKTKRETAGYTKIRKRDSVNGKGSQRKQECRISPSIVPAFVRRQSVLTRPPPAEPTKTSWPSSRVDKQRLVPIQADR